MANKLGLPGNGFSEEMAKSASRNNMARPAGAIGVHASTPFMTPKYAKWDPRRNHEFEDTMARLFIKVPPKDYKKFLKSLEDDQTKVIAQYLVGDNAKQGGFGYIDFFLQSVRHQFIEKVQVTEVLSDNYVSFFFGHQAPVFNYSGTLMNTYQDDWTMRMYRIFRDLGRGTQLAKHGQLLSIRYDSMIVSGAMTNFAWTLEAGRETYCDFSFDLLVKTLYVILGAASPPTKVADQFAPAWAHLEDTPYGTSSSAAKTYIGAAPVKPEGVSPATAAGAEPTQEAGPTGEQVEQLPAGSGVDDEVDAENPAENVDTD